jgi:hypothetical protein
MLPGQLLALFLFDLVYVHTRPPIYIDCASCASEKTSQVSSIDDPVVLPSYCLCSMRPTQELAQTALFTLPSEGFSISDRTKLSYERARAIGRAYGS